MAQHSKPFQITSGAGGWDLGGEELEGSAAAG